MTKKYICTIYANLFDVVLDYENNKIITVVTDGLYIVQGKGEIK